MRLRAAVLCILLSMGLPAGAAPTMVRDWGLHRQWRVEIDPAHPERPARLVEIRWTYEDRHPAESESRRGPGVRQRPAVRAGMRVTVLRRGAMAEIRLQGTALGTAAAGERIAVRAGLGNAVVEGVVLGPGVVELGSEKEP